MRERNRRVNNALRSDYERRNIFMNFRLPEFVAIESAPCEPNAVPNAPVTLFYFPLFFFFLSIFFSSFFSFLCLSVTRDDGLAFRVPSCRSIRSIR